MNRILRVDLLLVVALLVAGIIGLLEASDEPTYPTLSADLEPLRSDFNSKPENVRAVLLASPT